MNELIGSTIHRSQSSGTLSGGHGGGTEAFTARPTTVPMKAAPVPNPVVPKQVSRPAVAAAAGGGAANLPVSRAVVPTSMGTPISFKGKAMRPVGGPPPAGKKDALPGYIVRCSLADRICSLWILTPYHRLSTPPRSVPLFKGHVFRVH